MEPDRRAPGQGWFRALFVVAVTVLLTLAAGAVLTLAIVAVILTLAAVVAFLTPAVAAVILTGSFLHLLQYPFAPAQPLPGLGRKQRCDPYQ